MNDGTVNSSYSEYIRNLNYEDLIDIRRHIDQEKYHEKYMALCKRISEIENSPEFIKKEKKKEENFNSKIITYILAIGFLGVALLFEYLIKACFGNNSTIPQIGRFVFLLIVTFYLALRTKRDFDTSLRTLQILLNCGLGISLIVGVLPRLFDNGFQAALDLMLLKENMIYSPMDVSYSFKSNFIVIFGYGIAFWGTWCILLNKIKE